MNIEYCGRSWTGQTRTWLRYVKSVTKRAKKNTLGFDSWFAECSSLLTITDVEVFKDVYWKD